MKNKFICAIVILAGLLVGCSDWNDHYKTVQDGLEELEIGVLDYLKQENYSDILALMESTQVDTLFGKNKKYTLWVAPNGKYELIKNLVGDEKGDAVLHQITEGKYFESALKDQFVLRSLAGKMQLFNRQPALLVEKVPIIKTLANCSDGLIYEIQEPMILRKNLWEYIKGEAEYSMIVDLLMSELDTVFDPNKSTLTGEYDSEDNPLYDTVMVVQPSVFSKGNISWEQQHFTVFLSDNQLLKTTMEKFYEDRLQITGFAATKNDTTNLENWIKRSFITYELVETYGEEEFLYSSFGYKWNTNTQLVNSANRQILSNGYCYPLEQLIVPNTYLQLPLFSNIASISYDSDQTSFSASVSGEGASLVDQTTTTKAQVSGATYYMGALAELRDGYTETFPPFVLEAQWRALSFDEETLEANPVKIPPGEYQVTVTYYKSIDYQGDFEVFINGVRAGTATTEEGLWDKQNSALVGRVRLPQEMDVSPLVVTLRSISGSWKQGLAPISISLVPTNNNSY